MAAHEAGNINPRIAWLRRVASWTWRYWLRFLVWSVGPAFVSLIALYASHWTESSISTAGACLQWLGLAYVWRGVSQTRKQFNLPSVSKHVAEALRDFPRPHADIVGTADITTALQRSSATGTVGELGSVEPRDVMSRLDALEKDYQALRITVANHRDETQEQLRQHALELEAERAERANEGNMLRSALQETATGGLEFAVYGIFVGIVATLYSTFAHDIALSMGTAT